MLDHYVGQRDVLAPLEAAITSSRIMGRPLPNMLFLGGPGRGKTTLAKAVGQEMGRPVVTLHGSSTIERQSVVDKIMEAKGGILFIDEIHALPRQISEELYRVIDDGLVAVQTPKMQVEFKRVAGWADEPQQVMPSDRWLWHGPGYYWMYEPVSKRTKELQYELVEVKPITIIGATTDEALLPEPFYSRLSSLMIRLRPYTIQELQGIANNHATELGMFMTPMATETVAERARGIPRRVKHLTERAADFTVSLGAKIGSGDWIIQAADVHAALASLGIDQYGLEEPHRAILRILGQSERGLSRTSLAQSIGIPMRNLDTYWGDLVALGMVQVSTRHEITDTGRSAI